MFRLHLLVGVALVVAAGPVAGQRLQQLERQWKEAAAASARADSVARAEMRAQFDTVKAGSLIVLTPPSLRPLALASVPVAWSRLQAIYGDEAHLAGDQPIIVALYRSDSGPPPYGFPTDAVSVPVLPGSPHSTQLATQLDISIQQKLRSRFDPALDRWLSSALSVGQPDSAPPGAFEDLVTSPSPLARSCYVGSLSACGAILGLIPPTDPASEWYDAAGRRELVRHLPVDSREQVWVTQCVEQSVDAACVHLLRGSDSVYERPPLMSASRDLVVRIAVTAGGSRALHRLLTSIGRPVPRRLELAAGLPLDSLLARWRITVLKARPTSVVMSPGLGWVALGWALALGWLVLRSSRWRL